MRFLEKPITICFQIQIDSFKRMKVFFSFHYLNVGDFRVNVIRNSWRSKARSGQDTFIDYSLWEDAKTHSEKEI